MELVEGHGTEAGHIIVTTIGGKDGQPKQVTLVAIAFCTIYIYILIS